MLALGAAGRQAQASGRCEHGPRASHGARLRCGRCNDSPPNVLASNYRSLHRSAHLQGMIGPANGPDRRLRTRSITVATCSELQANPRGALPWSAPCSRIAV
jgi:hypothetical protein